MNLKEQLSDTMTPLILKISSYMGGVVSIVSAITFTDVGIAVGILTAILTYLTNRQYKRMETKLLLKREKRETEEHKLRMELMLRPYQQTKGESK